MRERPILFSSAMVRAILAGRKTMTRRIVRCEMSRDTALVRLPNRGEAVYLDDALGLSWIPYSGAPLQSWPAELIGEVSPYGIPGDRLWVRETWRTLKGFDAQSPREIAARCVDAGYSSPWAPLEYDADGARNDWDHYQAVGKTRVSIHMPRWASRITLEVTGVRCERLDAITEDDAKAEGVTPFTHDPEGDCWTARPRGEMYRSAFEYLWGEINGWDGEPKARAPWTTNPWVWVVEFRRVEQAKTVAVGTEAALLDAADALGFTALSRGGLL